MTENRESTHTGGLVLSGVTAGLFAAPQGTTSSVRFTAGQAILGRSPAADVEIIDPTGRVSRRHLLVECAADRWFLRDCGSTHGSVIKRDGVQVRLPPWMPQPVQGKAVLILARTVEITVTVETPSVEGIPTDMGSNAGSLLPVASLLDDDLLPVAVALTGPYRESPPRIDCASVSDMLGALPVARSTLYKRLSELGELPPIRGRLHAPVGSSARTRELAAVLVAAYPMLIDPGLS